MFFVILLFLPSFLFASFPTICLENTDTINISGVQYKEIGVDSLFKYPLPNENIKQYRERLKIKNIQDSKESVKTPITFWQIILIMLIIILVIFIIGIATLLNDIS
tara:strand:+ start:1995 stop:2312 length:318 start_codon:yes stop_codon:yes gene_type:complete